MYAADLVGATCGTLAVVPLLHVVPTPFLLGAAGALALLGVLLVDRSHRIAVLAGAVVLGGSLAWRERFQLHFTRGYSERAIRPLFEQWTPTARLTVFPWVFWINKPENAFGWGMGAKYVPHPLQQLWLEQDGSAGTPITRYSGDPKQLEHLAWDVTSVGSQIFHPREVCVIGAGGGRDILTALSNGAQRVTAVEINPHTIQLVSGRFGDFSGDVYHLPGVRAVASEGRSFLTRSPDLFDMIQISLIDSWAATSAGAYALSENYLYTVEAYRLYWNRLAQHG